MPTLAFKNAVQKILHEEGGYVNHPKDPGGETKYGISKRSYPNVDIAALTKTRATNIYYKDWWLKYGLEHITGEKIRTKLFSIMVNTGAHRAIILLQRAARCTTNNEIVLEEDGILGPFTLAAVNSLNPIGRVNLYYAFKSEVAAFYRQLNKPTFEKGWLNRAYQR